MKKFIKNMNLATFMMIFVIVTNLWISRLDVELYNNNIPIEVYWVVCTITAGIAKTIYDDLEVIIKEAKELIKINKKFKYIKKTENGLLKKVKS